MKSFSFNHPICHIAIIAAFVLAVMSPIFLNGITGGNDFRQHYQFALTFYDAIQHGEFYPGWASLPNFGFGDVGIRFYPPLSYYVLIIFRWISGNWFAASYLAFSFWFFLGGVGIYLWAREWFTGNAALVAALVYTFAPYHVNQIYNGFFYGEFAAAGILPFCFLFVTRILQRRDIVNVFYLAIAYAALVLTHLPMTLMGSCALVIYSLASLRKDVIVNIVKLGCGVALGLLASMFYWLRMVSELSFVNHSSAEFVSKAYDFRVNYLLGYFYVPETAYYERTLFFCDLLLLMTLAIGVPSAIHYCLRVRNSLDEKRLHLVGLFIFSVFISTPLSAFIWENVGVLQKIQFPFRWLAITSLVAAIFAASGFDHFAKVSQTKKLRPLAMIYAGLILTGLIFTVVQVIMPAGFSNRMSFEQQIDKLDSAQSFICWWPIWARQEAFLDREQVSAPDRRVVINEWNAESRQFTIEKGPAENVRVAVFYYPHWQAEIDGKPVNIEKDPNGAVLIPVPSSHSNVTLKFQEPYVNRAATFVSLATLLGLVIAGFLLIRRSTVRLATL